MRISYSPTKSDFVVTYENGATSTYKNVPVAQAEELKSLFNAGDNEKAMQILKGFPLNKSFGTSKK